MVVKVRRRQGGPAPGVALALTASPAGCQQTHCPHVLMLAWTSSFKLTSIIVTVNTVAHPTRTLSRGLSIGELPLSAIILPALAGCLPPSFCIL
jgi:hypothetical protein